MLPRPSLALLVGGIVLTAAPSVSPQALAQELVPIEGAFERPGATPRRSGNILYSLPPGWEAAERELGPDEWPATALRPEDWLDRDDYVEVMLPRGTGFAGTDDDLRAWGDAMLARTLDEDGESYEPSTWTDLSEGSGPGAIRFFAGNGLVRDAEDGEPLRAVVAALFLVGDRADMAYVTIDVDEPDAMQAQSALAAAALTGAVGTFSFLSLGAPPLLPPPVPGPYEGLWRGQFLSISLGIDAMMTTTAQVSSFVFTRDGRFVRDVPEGGLGVLADPELEMMLTDDAGHYVVEGSMIRLLYADGDTDEIEITGPDTLQHGQAALFPTDVPADGFTFDGTASSFSYTGLPSFGGPMGGSGVSTASDTAFRRDGTFDRSGSTSAIGNLPDVSYAVGSDSSAQGTYRIAGGELVLTAHDGTVMRGDVTILEGEDGPSLWWGTDEIELAPGQAIPVAGPPAPARLPARGAALPGEVRVLAAPALNPLAPGGAAANPLARPDAASGGMTTSAPNPLAPAVAANPLAPAPANPLTAGTPPAPAPGAAPNPLSP